MNAPQYGTEAEIGAELRTDVLVVGKIYVLRGTRIGVTMNYLGHYLFAGILVHFFHGPRARVSVQLADREGELFDGEGNKVTLLEYLGADQTA